MDIHVTVCGYFGIHEQQRLQAAIEREIPGSIVTIVSGSMAPQRVVGPTEYKAAPAEGETRTVVPEWEGYEGA